MWDPLSDLFTSSSDIRFGTIECGGELEKPICTKMNVLGHPTLVLYYKGEEVDRYEGVRTIDAMANYIQTKTGKIPSLQRGDSSTNYVPQNQQNIIVNHDGSYIPGIGVNKEL